MQIPMPTMPTQSQGLVGPCPRVARTEATALVVTAPPKTMGMTMCGKAVPPLNMDRVRQSAPHAPRLPAANYHMLPAPLKLKLSFLNHIPIRPPKMPQIR